MLIPLGTDRQSIRSSLVTPILVALNVVVFGWQAVTEIRAQEPQAYYELIAPWLIQPRALEWYQPLTSAFMHAGFVHLLGNMIFLIVFGPPIEDRFGRWWFLLFYIAGAYASGLAHAAIERAPALGASGAVSALTGAFLVLFPRTRVRVFFMLNVAVVSVSAWWVIGLAVLWDIVGHSVGRDNIAHIAHLAGVAFGAVVSFILLWTKVLPREMYDLFSMARQANRRRELRSAFNQRDRQFKEHWNNAKKKNGASSTASPDASEALALERAEVTRRLNAGDTPGAAAAYKALVEKHAATPGATTFSLKYQEMLAAHYYEQRDIPAAVYAMERLIEGYPHEGVTPRFKILLGLLCSRELNDPVKAKALLTEALEQVRAEDEREIARRELADLG